MTDLLERIIHERDVRPGEERTEVLRGIIETNTFIGSLWTYRHPEDESPIVSNARNLWHMDRWDVDSGRRAVVISVFQRAGLENAEDFSGLGELEPIFHSDGGNLLMGIFEAMVRRGSLTPIPSAGTES